MYNWKYHHTKEMIFNKEIGYDQQRNGYDGVSLLGDLEKTQSDAQVLQACERLYKSLESSEQNLLDNTLCVKNENPVVSNCI